MHNEFGKGQCVVKYCEMCESDYAVFHELANAYYREGEDENTPQNEVDAFIRFMFDKVVSKEIKGYFTQNEGQYVGFVLWAIDTEGFAFSEIPGCGTILEIGITPAYRTSGLGKELVAFVEMCMRKENVTQCYVSAYGPAQGFWAHCGYEKNGQTASNGLPIMIKTLH